VNAWDPFFEILNIEKVHKSKYISPEFMNSNFRISSFVTGSTESGSDQVAGRLALLLLRPLLASSGFVFHSMTLIGFVFYEMRPFFSNLKYCMLSRSMYVLLTINLYVSMAFEVIGYFIKVFLN